MRRRRVLRCTPRGSAQRNTRGAKLAGEWQLQTAEDHYASTWEPYAIHQGGQDGRRSEVAERGTREAEDRGGGQGIDKLAVTFDTKRARELLKIARSAGQHLEIDAGLYLRNFRCGRVLVQHGEPLAGSAGHRRLRRDKKRRSSRLEFNPALASSDDWSVARRVLALALSSSLRVSQVDIAVDVPGSIRRLQVLAIPGRKVNTYLGALGVETIYRMVARSGDK